MITVYTKDELRKALKAKEKKHYSKRRISKNYKS